MNEQVSDIHSERLRRQTGWVLDGEVDIEEANGDKGNSSSPLCDQCAWVDRRHRQFLAFIEADRQRSDKNRRERKPACLHLHLFLTKIVDHAGQECRSMVLFIALDHRFSH